MRPPMVAPVTTGEEIVDVIDAGAGAGVGVGVGDDTRIPHAYLLRAVMEYLHVCCSVYGSI